MVIIVMVGLVMVMLVSDSLGDGADDAGNIGGVGNR